MWFTVTREGRPLRMRRYVFSQAFAAIANAAYAKASGDARAAEDALKTFATYLRYSFEPGVMAPKLEASRPAKGIGAHKIGIVTAQELRANLGDVRGLPVQECGHDMKFWWPHSEVIIPTLLAWQVTGNAKYARRHQQVRDWSFAHFSDPPFGEWYGYLHRDGGVSVRLKGNPWNGPFHLPRMLWYATQLLTEPNFVPPPR